MVSAVQRDPDATEENFLNVTLNPHTHARTYARTPPSYLLRRLKKKEKIKKKTIILSGTDGPPKGIKHSHRGMRTVGTTDAIIQGTDSPNQ